MSVSRSNGNIFRITGHLCGNTPVTGEFSVQRPVTQSFDVFFDLRLNKRLSKQWWCRWFETSPRPLWRHCNVVFSLLRRHKSKFSTRSHKTSRVHWPISQMEQWPCPSSNVALWYAGQVHCEICEIALFYENFSDCTLHVMSTHGKARVSFC